MMTGREIRMRLPEPLYLRSRESGGGMRGLTDETRLPKSGDRGIP